MPRLADFLWPRTWLTSFKGATGAPQDLDPAAHETIVQAPIVADPDVYVVKRIVDDGVVGGRQLFRVRWWGWRGRDTLEPIENLDDCPRALAKYLHNLSVKVNVDDVHDEDMDDGDFEESLNETDASDDDDDFYDAVLNL
jgi:hypothetical protein